MESVVGVGGVFFRAERPSELAEWYRTNLGVPLEKGQAYGVFTSGTELEHTVWAAFPSTTDYFGRPEKQFMINFRVRDLDAMLKQLRTAGVEVLDDVHEDSNGRFGWAVDPEGNRIELWEPQ